MTTGTTGGQFAYGPATTVWVFVNTSNALPRWGNDGSILTSYSPSKSWFMSSLFNGFTRPRL
jgi:hypothetical protein